MYRDLEDTEVGDRWLDAYAEASGKCCCIRARLYLIVDLSTVRGADNNNDESWIAMALMLLLLLRLLLLLPPMMSRSL
jgi:hypothetical protein